MPCLLLWSIFSFFFFGLLLHYIFYLPRLSCDSAGGQDSQEFQNGIGKVMESENACSSGGTQLEAINLPQNKKLRESNSGMFLETCEEYITGIWTNVFF